MTTSTEAKLNKLDEQTNIERYRVTALMIFKESSKSKQTFDVNTFGKWLKYRIFDFEILIYLVLLIS